MSTPKLNTRNHSILIKRDFSTKRFPSRERNVRESDDTIVKKRFKIQPYSSFEDKFIEQDKINNYIFDLLSKLESKLFSQSDNTAGSDKLEIISRNLQTFSLEIDRIKESSQDFFDFKLAILKKLGDDDEFKGKSSEKDKVLFEEVVRIGKVLENVENDMGVLKKKSVNPGKVSSLSHSLENIDEKLRFFELSYESLKESIENESNKIMKISQSNNILRQEIENYVIQINNSLNLNINNHSELFHKKIIDEQEIRQKNNIDLARLIEEKFSSLNEKFAGEILTVKNSIHKLEAGLNMQRSGVEDLQKDIFLALKKGKKDFEESVNLLNDRIYEVDHKLNQSIQSFKESQDKVFLNFSTTILAEMKTRIEAEHEIQNMIKITTKNIFQELLILQERLNELTQNSKITEQEVRNSISEKCDLLSRFIESEIKKLKKAFTASFHRYQSLVPKDTDSKINSLREVFTKLFNQVREDALIRFTSIYRGFENTNEKIKNLGEETNKALENFYKELRENEETVQQKLEKLDEKISVIDENSYNDLNQITEYVNIIQEDIAEIRFQKKDYEEIIASLETKIDLKIATEKITREHMVSYYFNSSSEAIKSVNSKISEFHKSYFQTFAKSKDFQSLLVKLEEVDRSYIELSKAFDAYKKNINSEIADFLEEGDRIREKVEIGQIIIEEMKSKLNDINDNYKKFGVMLKNSFKEQEKEKRIAESTHLLNDLTSRVETIGILSKLNEILADMDSNERETQMMLGLYKKELEHIQDKQKKGLDDAQDAVRSIFDLKISGLQNMVSEEMSKIMQFIESNKINNPNISSLQEYAERVKILP